jgi:hypothetical protein
MGLTVIAKVRNECWFDASAKIRSSPGKRGYRPSEFDFSDYPTTQELGPVLLGISPPVNTYSMQCLDI